VSPVQHGTAVHTSSISPGTVGQSPAVCPRARRRARARRPARPLPAARPGSDRFRCEGGTKDRHRARIIRSTAGMGGLKMSPGCRRIQHPPLDRPSLRGSSELVPGWSLNPDLLRGSGAADERVARWRGVREKCAVGGDDSAANRRRASARARDPRDGRSRRPGLPNPTSTNARLPQPRRSSSVG
jgi:hypothetical protein